MGIVCNSSVFYFTGELPWLIVGSRRASSSLAWTAGVGAAGALTSWSAPSNFLFSMIEGGLSAGAAKVWSPSSLFFNSVSLKLNTLMSHKCLPWKD